MIRSIIAFLFIFLTLTANANEVSCPRDFTVDSSLINGCQNVCDEVHKRIGQSKYDKVIKIGPEDFGKKGDITRFPNFCSCIFISSSSSDEFYDKIRCSYRVEFPNVNPVGSVAIRSFPMYDKIPTNLVKMFMFDGSANLSLTPTATTIFSGLYAVYISALKSITMSFALALIVIIVGWNFGLYVFQTFFRKIKGEAREMPSVLSSDMTIKAMQTAFATLLFALPVNTSSGILKDHGLMGSKGQEAQNQQYLEYIKNQQYWKYIKLEPEKQCEGYKERKEEYCKELCSIADIEICSPEILRTLSEKNMSNYVKDPSKIGCFNGNWNLYDKKTKELEEKTSVILKKQKEIEEKRDELERKKQRIPRAIDNIDVAISYLETLKTLKSDVDKKKREEILERLQNVLDAIIENVSELEGISGLQISSVAIEGLKRLNQLGIDFIEDVIIDQAIHSLEELKESLKKALKGLENQIHDLEVEITRLNAEKEGIELRYQALGLKVEKLVRYAVISDILYTGCEKDYKGIYTDNNQNNNNNNNNQNNNNNNNRNDGNKKIKLIQEPTEIWLPVAMAFVKSFINWGMSGAERVANYSSDIIIKYMIMSQLTDYSGFSKAGQTSSQEVAQIVEEAKKKEKFSIIGAQCGVNSCKDYRSLTSEQRANYIKQDISCSDVYTSLAVLCKDTSDGFAQYEDISTRVENVKNAINQQQQAQRESIYNRLQQDLGKLKDSMGWLSPAVMPLSALYLQVGQFTGFEPKIKKAEIIWTEGSEGRGLTEELGVSNERGMWDNISAFVKKSFNSVREKFLEESRKTTEEVNWDTLIKGESNVSAKMFMIGNMISITSIPPGSMIKKAIETFIDAIGKIIMGLLGVIIGILTFTAPFPVNAIAMGTGAVLGLFYMVGKKMLAVFLAYGITVGVLKAVPLLAVGIPVIFRFLAYLKDVMIFVIFLPFYAVISATKEAGRTLEVVKDLLKLTFMPIVIAFSPLVGFASVELTKFFAYEIPVYILMQGVSTFTDGSILVSFVAGFLTGILYVISIFISAIVGWEMATAFIDGMMEISSKFVGTTTSSVSRGITSAVAVLRPRTPM